MEDEKELRTVEVMVAGTGWTPCKFEELLEGDLFRMFEATGEIVLNHDGSTEFEAESDAEFNGELWMISAIPPYQER